MTQKKMCKIVSLLAVMALLVTSVFTGSALTISADSTGYDLQAVVDAGNVTVTNDTTKETLLTSLQALTLPDGYSVADITEFYNLNAHEGVIEDGSTYEGAENYNGKVLVPGVDGAVGATVSLNTPDGTASAVISITIEAPMVTRGYATVSNLDPNPETNPDWIWSSTDGGRWEYTPASGDAAEKLVVPNNIDKLTNDWHQGYDENSDGTTYYRDNIKCVVFSEALETVPYSGGIYPEVISFAGNKVTALGSYTNQHSEYFGTFQGMNTLKYIRLPDSLKTIANEAFKYCAALNSLYIPENVETIGNFLFIDSDDGWTKTQYSFTQVTVPASVQSIGGRAFYAPANPTTYTVLSNASGLSSLSFVGEYAAGNTINGRATVRGFKDSSVLTFSLPSSNACSVMPTFETLETSMTLAEAAARVKQKADKLYGTTYNSDDILLSELAEAIGSISTVSLSVKNSIWEENNGLIENSVVLTKDGVSAEIGVTLSKLPTYDLQSAAENITVTNDTTADTLLADLQALTIDGYTVEVVSEFYKVKAIDEAIESGSTYEGAEAYEGEVLAEGVDGAVSAVVTVKDAEGNEYTSFVSFVIEPETVTYSFASISNDEDFIYRSESWYLRWQYMPENNGRTPAEKVVIPDNVTTLTNDWHPYDSDGSFNAVRCIVYNKNITTIPYQYYIGGLEVVSFKGAVTTISGSAFRDAVNLKSIRLPDTVTTIGTNAFGKCKLLTTMYLPDGLTTMGDAVFEYHNSGWSDRGQLKLEDITIPASVTTLGAGIFDWPYGGSYPLTVTYLNPNYSANVDVGLHSGGMNVVMRGWGTTYGTMTNHTAAAGNTRTKVDISDMSITEAASRVNAAAQLLTDTKFVNADTVLTKLKNAYGNIPAVNAGWKNADFQEVGESYTNTLVLIKNGVFAEIPVTLAKPYDLQSSVGSITVTNATTADTLLADLQALTMEDGYSVEAITNFYLYKAIEGVIEEGSTYEGAEDYNGKVLVPGVNGAAGATVSLNTPNGVESAVVTFVIEAPMATRGYASMSNPEPDPTKNPDWFWHDYNGRWQYTPESGTAAEKILIPNEITEMKNDWHQSWTENADGSTDSDGNATTYATNIKCVVFPENLTVIPCSNGLPNVEVVSFAGDKATTLATYTQVGDGWTTDWGTFENFSSLKYIRLPDGITAIPNRAFAGCSLLTTLYIPESVTSIGDMAFYAHRGDSWSNRVFHYMEEITIPSSVTSIGTYAFYYPLKNATTADTFTITYLNPAVTGASVGYDSSGKHITMRIENTSASDDVYDSINISNSYRSKEDLGAMTIAEAAARVVRKAEMLSDSYFTDTATVTKQLLDSCGNIAGLSITFKNSEWTIADGVQSNTAVLSKGGVIAEIEVAFVGKTSFYADGASILTTEAFTANNNKQGLRFYNSFESSSANKVMIKGVEYDIVEFGVVLKHVGTDATSAKYNTVDDSEFVLGATGVTQIVGKENTIQTSSGINFYTVYVKNIPQGGRNYSFQCRGYIKYQDGDTVKIQYTDSQVKSISDVFSANSLVSEYVGMTDWFAGN